MRNDADGPGATAAIVVLAVAVIGVGVARFLRPIALGGDGRPVGRLAAAPDMRIDVNTCPAAELTVIPGIGPRLANRIVAERRSGGPFTDLDDLRRVDGIGPALTERMTPYVVVEDPASGAP